MIKDLKYFRVYILHSNVVAYAPSIAVKDILTQPDPEGRRVKRIVVLLEYDLEIKHTKLIKGQGLAKLMAETGVEDMNISFLDISNVLDQTHQDPDISEDFLASPWYRDIIYVLKNLQAPLELTGTKARSVKLKSSRYYIINGFLYWKDPRGVLLNYLLEAKVMEKMNEFHKKDCGGHLLWKTTTYKILRVGFYWPTLFPDVYKETSTCHECQIFEGKRKLKPLPLVPISVEAPFQQWGLDFTGEINPISSGQHKWILTAIDFFTEWIEAIPTRQATDTIIIDFLLSHILSRFGCPRRLITDNAQAFSSSRLVKFCNEYNIVLSHSTTYYPQGNGLAESSNKSLMRTIKKLLQENKKAWNAKLIYALWANRIGTKKSIGTSPFQLV